MNPEVIREAARATVREALQILVKGFAHLNDAEINDLHLRLREEDKQRKARQTLVEREIAEPPEGAKVYMFYGGDGQEHYKVIICPPAKVNWHKHFIPAVGIFVSRLRAREQGGNPGRVKVRDFYSLVDDVTEHAQTHEWISKERRGEPVMSGKRSWGYYNPDTRQVEAVRFTPLDEDVRGTVV